MDKTVLNKSQGKKKELLNNALNLFAEKGFHETTLNDIASASNLTKGGLYHHLQSKEEILFLLHERFITEGITKLNKIDMKELSPEVKFIELLKTHLDIIHEYKPDITLFFMEIDNLSAEKYYYIKNKRTEYENFFMKSLEEGIKQGLFAVNDSKVALMFILGASNFMYHWYDPNGKLTIEELKDIYLGLVTNGIVTK